jgi:hypothetical protein
VIVLVLRSGGIYVPDDVDQLIGQIRQHTREPIRVLTDCWVPKPEHAPASRVPLEHGWPGWWSKMELFRPDLAGDFLFMDLDTVVRGPVADFLAIGRLTLLRDFYRTWGLGSGLMFLPEADRAEIWLAWTADPARWMAEHAAGGDQAFLERFWLAKAARWQDVLPGRVASYKAAGKAEREQAAVVCFHGEPKPRDVLWRV